MKLKGAQVVIECLREQGVDVIFGFPGGAILPVYDALYDAHDIKHILTAHEQGATHAADGYARATGKTGVVVVTSGPGATNTVTGIATAYMDSVPMVILTGQVPCSLLGKDSFQEVDITGITAPITKHNYIVKSAARLPDIMREAFKIARTGRPGPVLVDLPKDIQNADIEYVRQTIDTSYVSVDSYHPQSHDKGKWDNSIKEAIEAINKSEKPVIYAGGGVKISGANGCLVEFAEKIKSPVVSSFMGVGAFPGDHPNFLGMVGMHGTRASNYAVSHCDLLIAVGARFSDRVVSRVDKFASKAKVIHIDIDPAELSKNVHAHIPVCGDVKASITALIEGALEKKVNGWTKQIEEWQQNHPLKYDSSELLSPQFVIEKLCEVSKGNAVITTEVGQNQMWAAQFYKYRNIRSFISSGGLGTMGYGLGAAIGACIGRPEDQVVNIAGDGSFMMNSTELATISRYRLPIIQLVLNNQALGMVRQWQTLFFKGRYSQTTLGGEVDFVKLAEAYGIKGIRITSDSQVEETLKYAFSLREPVIIECAIHSDAKVFPIVPPGAAIDEIID